MLAAILVSAISIKMCLLQACHYLFLFLKLFAFCRDLSLGFIKVVEVQRYDTILVVDWLFTG